MTSEEIKQALEKMDVLLRPFAIVCNPVDANLFKEALPDLDERMKLYTSSVIDPGQAYIINRSQLEKYQPLDLIYEEDES